MPKPDMKAAIKVGESLAAQTLRRRRKAATMRKQALAANAARETRRMAAGRARPEAVALAAVSAGTLIAEGDSWFDYPFDDVLAELQDSYGYDVESVAHRGDAVENMAYGGGQLDAFARRVEK